MASVAAPRRSRRATPRRPDPRRRIRLLLAGCLALLAVVLVRGVQLQVIDHGRFAQIAAAEHQQRVALPAMRGAIVDRHGRSLAISEQAVTIGAYVPMLHPDQAAAAVARALGIDGAAIYARLTRARHGHIDLVRQADPLAAQRLAPVAASLALTLIPEQHRVYPARIGTPLVGTTNIDGTGLAGLESSYDAALRGQAGWESFTRDATGQTISPIAISAVSNGAQLGLTIDTNLQSAAEDAATATRERQRAADVIVVMLDPRTGGVLAMASAPGPGSRPYGQASAAQVRIRGISDQYEPGSTFKTVTIAAGLARGAITPRTRIWVQHCVQLFKARICDAEQHPDQWMTVQDILTHSSNVGAFEVAYRYLSGTGPADHGVYLAPYLSRFGFGTRTGIDLPGEVTGRVPAYTTWSGVTIGNIPFGQGLALTPIQLASFYAMIANGGVWMRPHLVGSVGGVPVKPVHQRMLAPRVARTLTTLLEDVVTPAGTGVQAAINGYRVAGKTGTTQKVIHGAYSRSHFVASFVGYAPAANPRVLTLVIVDDPRRGSYYGGAAAAPVFRQLTERALRLMGVPTSG